MQPTKLTSAREDETRNFAHPMFTHPDGTQCIWPDTNGWFVPYDVGGEGVDCTRWHPGDDERWTITRLTHMLTTSTNGAVEPDDAEQAEFVTTALRAVEADSAGHWPTVAAVLADEVTRLRALVTTVTAITNPQPDATQDAATGDR